MKAAKNGKQHRYVKGESKPRKDGTPKRTESHSEEGKANGRKRPNTSDKGRSSITQANGQTNTGGKRERNRITWMITEHDGNTRKELNETTQTGR